MKVPSGHIVEGDIKGDGGDIGGKILDFWAR